MMAISGVALTGSALKRIAYETVVQREGDSRLKINDGQSDNWIRRFLREAPI